MALSCDDRVAITELIALHGHLVDTGRLGRFGRFDELFTADVEYDLSRLGGGVLRGAKKIGDAARTLGDQNPIVHHVTNTVITEQGDGVTARSKFLGVRADGTVGSGTYEDELVLVDGRWRISRRCVALRREPLRP